MSDKSNPLVEALQKAMEASNEQDIKASKIKTAKLNAQYNKILENEAKVGTLKDIDIFNRPAEYYEKLEIENDEYLDNAKESAMFLTSDFHEAVPFFQKNLIIIGAKSGEGKSTIASNIALETIKQGKHCLMITNEEVDTDVFNRVTCLINGWAYNNHKKFTDEQRLAFKKNYSLLGKRLLVLNDMSNGSGGATTSIQGLKSILDKVVESEVKTACIILDYFQNVNEDIESQGESEYTVLKRVASLLDKYRKYVGCPIVVMVQMKAESGEGSDFKFRIEHCKEIYTKSTCALEVTADRESRRTIFTVRKSRFADALSKEIAVGFDKGRYVKYDHEFKMRAIANMDARKHTDTMANVMTERKLEKVP